MFLSKIWIPMLQEEGLILWFVENCQDYSTGCGSFCFGHGCSKSTTTREGRLSSVCTLVGLYSQLTASPVPQFYPRLPEREAEPRSAAANFICRFKTIWSCTQHFESERIGLKIAQYLLLFRQQTADSWVEMTGAMKEPKLGYDDTRRS